jgi:hypothetical protein
MCDHDFKKTHKKEISYCTKCGNLSYKNIPSLSIQFNSKYLFEIDPFLLKYKYSKKIIDFSNNSINKYLNFRNIGINQIKILSNLFSFSKISYYKAIHYLDQIYINNPSISIDLIEKISSVCLLLSVQFNECCSQNSNIDIKTFIQFLLSKIKNLNEIEILCLKNLDYNLEIYSSYDYLNLFFSHGLIFPNENKIIEQNEDSNIINLYLKCVNILDIIIEDYNCLGYTQYIIAVSIIGMVLTQSKLFSIETFKYVYGINLLKEKYRKCQNVLKSIYINNYFFCHEYYSNKSQNSLSSDSTNDNSVF